jgi:hypothetical protein
MAASHTLQRPGYGAHTVHGQTRRGDAPAARGITRYDAPTSGTTRRLDMPAARSTQYHAPSYRSGTAYDAPRAHTRTGVRA